MSVSSDFLNYVLEQLSRCGEVSARRMFGAAGLFRNGVMFGLVADDVAYLKADDSNREDFLREGSSPFQFQLDSGRDVIMDYYEIPGDVLEDPDRLAAWVEGAWAAARKGKRDKPKRSGRGK
jgi:DNA transformation protein